LGNGVTTSYAYDGANHVTNITVNNGATNLWAESYAYNAAGERISTTRSNGSDSYQYDDTYQLTGASYGTGSNASSASWSYDASGNRTQAQSVSGTNTLGISYSVNEINQYTSVGEASPSYNSRGDLSSINGWSFTYDAFGNLSAAQSGTNAAYHYARDPLGRRAIRQSGSNTIVLLNAGDTMLEAYNASNSSATSYIYEPGIDRPLAQVLSNGTIRYVHQDVLGSVVMLTDSNGAPYQSYSYDAWGKVTARDASGSVITSSAISAPWLFTGRRYDRESGLYHYRARTYSAELGRFLQMDPIKFDAGDPNIYRYVGNDPVNGRDPWGLCDINNITTFAGVNLSIIPFGGATFELGVYSSPDGFGLFASAGTGQGLDMSLSGNWGYINGSASDFAGPFINSSLGVGKIGGTVLQNGSEKTVGYSASFGPGLTPISGSITHTSTAITPPISFW
jgi:RHS repeat-associated protein